MGNAAAWFWFTIMTTVGYGNQAPETNAGRIMVFTLGFASLLVFGAILARAGQIIAAIFADAFVRFHWNFLTRPWVICLIFGASYSIWMFVIAAQTDAWKEDRLGESFDLRYGRWFAYISTTTIGLGDIFLEPEVILSEDVYIWSLSFLTGFALFSVFLGQLTEVSLPWRRRKGFYESLLDRLETTHLPPAAETTASFPNQVNERTIEVIPSRGASDQ
jgi:hypothetical protein